MFTLILLLVLWSGVLLGVGGTARQFLFRDQLSQPLVGGLGVWMLLGLIALGWVALILNFWISLSSYCSLSVMVMGWILFVRNFSEFKNIVQASDIFLWGISVLVSSLMAIVSFYNIDTGYYHLPSVTLIRNFPLLPGVANIFGPYGHTSTWFLIEGLLGLPLISPTSIFSLNALLAVVFFMFLGDWVRQKGSTGIFAFILVTLFSFNHIALGLGGLSPDLPVSILSIIVWVFFLDFVLTPTEQSGPELSLALLTVVFAITIKISAVALLFPLSAMIIFGKRSGPASFSGLLNQSHFRKTVCLGAVFTIFWALRSSLSSGCLVFPQMRTCFESLPWAMPLERVTFWMNDVKYHLCGVRMNGTIFSNSQCLENWFYNLKHEPILKSLGLVLGISILFGAVQTVKNPKVNWRVLKFKKWFFALGVLVACGVVLLLTAPNLRFAIWLPLAAVGLFVELIFEVVQWKRAATQKMLYLGIVWACLITLRSALLTRTEAVDWNHWPSLPKRGFGVEAQVGSFAITSPIGDFKCWDSSPPCTPEKTQVDIHQTSLGRVWFSSSEKKRKVDHENPHCG